MHPDALVELATFAEVVRAGSFSAAAEAMHVSKSVVSRRVSSLEERLSARLLNRTTRRRDLTETGAAVYGRAVRILEEAEEAEIAASVLAEEPRGVLSVNAPLLLARARIVPTLPAFLERWPEVRVDLSATDQLLDVVGGGFDLTLRIGGHLEDASYVARRLVPVRMALVASPDYLARRGVPHSTRDLATHDLLRYTRVPGLTEWTFDDGERAVRLVANGSFASDNGLLIVEGVQAGLGIGVLPDVEVRDCLDAGSLVEVLPDTPRAERWLYALYPHRAGLPPKVTAFLDHLVQILS